jgi:acyl-CoA thioesterase
MTRFDDTTTLVPGAEHGRFTVEIDPAWSSLRGVHGGFLAALAVRATERVEDSFGEGVGRDVRTSTTSFLRPARPGLLDVHVEPVRDGRTLGTYAVTASQNGRDVATSRVTAVVPSAGTSWETATPDDSMPPPDECVAVEPPEGVRHFENATGLLDPSYAPFSHGPEARVRGYVRPLEPRPIDATWLTMILDWFPPASFTRNDPPIGGVSVDFTVHVHRTLAQLAPDEWLAGRFHADVSTGGLALEKGTICDQGGHVIAEAFHTRWTA